MRWSDWKLMTSEITHERHRIAVCYTLFWFVSLGKWGRCYALTGLRNFSWTVTRPFRPGCNMAGFQPYGMGADATKRSAPGLFLPLAVAYSNCFSGSHAKSIGRGVGHPLSYPLKSLKYFVAGNCLEMTLKAGLLLRQEGEGDGGDDANEGGDVVPGGPGLEIEQGEDGEDGEGDDFLDDL